MLAQLVIAGIAGAIGLFVLQTVLHVLLDIPEVRDGQYPLILFGTLPAGGLLGALTAAGLELQKRVWPAFGAWLWIVGGVALAVLCWRYTATPSQYGGRLRNFALFGGLPFLWSVLLIVRGWQSR